MAIATLTPRLYFIYALIDPRTETVYYVGQTVNLTDRFIAHLCSGGKRRKLTPVEEFNVELKLAGIRPVLIVLDTIETYHQEIALRLEECWRIEMISRDEILANRWKTGRCVDTENPMAEAAFIRQYAIATDEQIAGLNELDKQRAMRKVWG